MGNIVMKEQWVNATESCMLGETEWYEAYTDDEGELFRSMQKDAGRCTGKVYVDLPRQEAWPIGWVFLKRTEYSDVRGQYYLRETWVSMKHRYPYGKKGE